MRLPHKRVSAMKASVKLKKKTRPVEQSTYSDFWKKKCIRCDCYSSDYPLACVHSDGADEEVLCQACADAVYIESGRFFTEPIVTCFGENCTQPLDVYDVDDAFTDDMIETRARCIGKRELDKTLQKVLKLKRYHACPKCNTVYEKTGGCDSMSCLVCFTMFSAKKNQDD